MVPDDNYIINAFEYYHWFTLSFTQDAILEIIHQYTGKTRCIFLLLAAICRRRVSYSLSHQQLCSLYTRLWRNHWSLNKSICVKTDFPFPECLQTSTWLYVSADSLPICGGWNFIWGNSNVPEFIQKVPGVFDIAGMSISQWFYEMIYNDWATLLTKGR